MSWKLHKRIIHPKKKKKKKLEHLYLYQNAVRIGEVSESTIYSTGLKREQTYKQIQYN